MPNLLRISLFLIVAQFFIPVLGRSHGDLGERIAAVTKEIEMHPDSAYLYFKRGKLKYEHEEYASAIEDLHISADKGYDDLMLDLMFSQSYIKLDSLRQALYYANKILQSDSMSVNAMKMVGKAYFAMDSFEHSALAFESVINNTVRTFPFNYIDAANSWEKMGDIKGFDYAQQILERGIEELGPIISLYERLVRLGLDHANYELAIQYESAIIDIMQRKEFVLYKRGMIYKMMENTSAAKKDFNAALAAIDLLPDRARNNGAMRQLITDLKAEIQ